jgi:hypothetical protein
VTVQQARADQWSDSLPCCVEAHANDSATMDQARSNLERDVGFACEKEEGCSPMSEIAPLLVVETLIFVIMGYRFPK